MPALPYTADSAANALLGEDPFALLVGLLLHQQVPTEWAFGGPARIADRLGGLDLSAIAAMSPDDLATVFSETPAVHRFPAAMAKRVHALSQALLDEYDGDASKLWSDVASAAELRKRIEALPGFGTYKARILIGILANNFGVRPEGWNDERASWPSVADVTKFEDVAAIKERKAAWKASQK